MSIKTMTPEEQAAFDQWAEECKIEKILDANNEVVAVMYSHLSNQIHLNIADFPEGIRHRILG
jgi:hypothetical protein